MTPEQKLMDLYRFQGYTDGQAREAAKTILAEITASLNGDYRKALEEIAAMPDSDYQDDRTHQCVARQVLGMPKCEFKAYCKVCWPEGA